MSGSTDLVRVVIPTTEGPAIVCQLQRESSELGEAVAVIAGTRELAGISSAYDEFVHSEGGLEGGLIEHRFGGRAWRLDLSRDIQAGRSWEAGIFLAHVLEASGRLAGTSDAPSVTVWITGSLDKNNLSAGAVEHTDRKLSTSLPALMAAIGSGSRVIAAVPRENAGFIDAPLREQVCAAGFELVEYGNCSEIVDLLGLSIPVPRTNGWRPVQSRRPTLLAFAATAIVAFAALAIVVIARTFPNRAPEAALLQSIQDCSNCPEMIALPPWTPTAQPAAASPPQPRRFAMGKYSVTLAEYDAFIAETGREVRNRCNVPTREKSYHWERVDRSFRNPSYPVTPHHPVTCVSWEDAYAYAQWLANKTGRPYRLPTAAEHEFAARAGSKSRYVFGDSEESLCRHGRFAHAGTPIGPLRGVTLKCDGNDAHGPLPVGSLQPNAWQLHDMLGNVWQWMSDCAPSTVPGPPEAAERPQVRGRCESRVIRGGGYNSVPSQLLPSYFEFEWNDDRSRSDAKGFRVLLDLTYYLNADVTAVSNVAPPLTMMATPSVVVLPLQAAAGRPVGEGADLPERIASGLVRTPRGYDLTVKAPSSVGVPVPSPGAAALSLEVRYVIATSVLGPADHRQAFVELVEGPTGRQIWSQRYTLKMVDDARQNVIAARIARTLAVQIRIAELARPVPAELEAGHYVLQGRALIEGERGAEVNTKAMALFDKALVIKPDHIPSLLGYARTRIDIVANGWRPEADWPQLLSDARAAVERIIRQDNSVTGAHMLRGAIEMAAGKVPEAIKSYEYARETNPTYPYVHAELGRALNAAGRFNESVPHIQRAMELTELDPNMSFWCLWAGIASVQVANDTRKAEDFAKAVDWLLQARQLNTNLKNHRPWLAVAYDRLGDIENARKIVSELVKDEPNFTLSRWQKLNSRGNAAAAGRIQHVVATLRELGVPSGE